MEKQNGHCDAEITHSHGHGTEIQIFNGLPSIAALNVLRFLDPGTLRNLRGVCRQTKWLIDSTPSVMKQLRVYIQDEFRMEEMLKSEVNWSKIQIPSELCNVKLFPFLHRFRSSITRIKIVNDKDKFYPESLNPIDLINILVELNGGFLETLCIRVDLAPKWVPYPDINSDLHGTEEFDINILKTLLKDSKEILWRNLRRLRRLEFRELCSSALILDLLFNCFHDVCGSLVYIRFPRLFSWKEGQGKDECGPLTSYLIRIVDSPRKHELITIDFGSVGIGSHWYVRGHSGCPFYHLTTDRFMKLLKSFEKENLKVRLLNVMRLSLPQEKILSDVEKKMLNRFVYSIHWTKFGRGESMRGMYIPLNCQAKISLWLNHGRFIVKRIQCLIPTALNITTLRILDYERDTCKGYFNAFLAGALYPTVVSLMIRWDYVDSSLTTILSQTFPNVRKLYLSGCRRLDCYSDESPLNDLNQLEELTLKDCGLDKNACIGGSAQTHPLFTKFKKLRRLRLL